MPIDDPNSAVEEQYFKEKEKSPVDLTLFVGKLAFPKAALLIQIFQKVYDRFQRVTVEERLKALWDRFVEETEHIESTKLDADDVQEAIQLALHRDAEEFNDKKRERYVRLIANALRSEAQVKDLASFVQTIEQLGELDVKVLRVLNQVMNKESDWQPPGRPPLATLHPNTFIQRRQELAVQIAQALGQDSKLTPSRQTFSHEEGYEICARLQGFGLAIEVQVAAREVPTGDYCFRPSKRGLMLLKMLGEDVPNFDKYF